jgi:tripartite-type tricarboxylate transporter receptor subunit TctC
LTEALQKPVVVDNVTGAAGNIAAERIAKAAPDGYTLGLVSQTHVVVNPLLYRLAYDPAKDFAPISQVSVSPSLLVVHTAVAAKSVAELVALGKAQPGGLTFASSGSGSGTHMAAELFKSATALDICSQLTTCRTRSPRSQTLLLPDQRLSRRSRRAVHGRAPLSGFLNDDLQDVLEKECA